MEKNPSLGAPGEERRASHAIVGRPVTMWQHAKTGRQNQGAGPFCVCDSENTPHRNQSVDPMVHVRP
ncbi:hypothetical protein EYF80_049082 [Liparis tanakae]|uniref:Uncharacterized protein n=1 Tax=Liparis tanakae TaxID=230148 RepID=A0A4Z2FIF7_9TELE|nr:hypothetical protein EYF80_049082 [Liparis tanakae]